MINNSTNMIQLLPTIESIYRLRSAFAVLLTFQSVIEVMFEHLSPI